MLCNSSSSTFIAPHSECPIKRFSEINFSVIVSLLSLQFSQGSPQLSPPCKDNLALLDLRLALPLFLLHRKASSTTAVVKRIAVTTEHPRTTMMKKPSRGSRSDNLTGFADELDEESEHSQKILRISSNHIY